MALEAIKSDTPNEVIYPVEIGSGMYTSELATNIPDGFSPVCYNLVATGDSLENRIGIRRLSFDWNRKENAPGSKQPMSGTSDTFADYHNFFTTIDPWSKDSSKVAFAWGGRGRSIVGDVLQPCTLNLIRAAGTIDANDGFISANLGTDPVYGICQYAGDIYYSLEGAGIRKITNVNWATDVITSVAIASSGTGTLRDIFVFKDRMWGLGSYSVSHVLYYTDIAPTGGNPETWAYATNKIPIVGPNGNGEIRKIIPLGNKLVIFTSNGIFTLLVAGAPASWILRILDSKSISTTTQCAFESKGLIYYVNTEGVWATNSLSIKKLSGTIEDQWFLAKGSRAHSIVYYEDGMIVSIAKHKTTDDKFFDKDNCRIFYSKLDPVGWTEWNINRFGPTSGDNNFAMIWSTTDKIPTYLNNDPTVYAMAFVTNSTEAVSKMAVAQLLIMDGGEDQFVNIDNVAEAHPVRVFLKTKHFDGGNPYRLKQSRYGIVEVFTSDAEHLFTVSWDNDFTIDETTEIEVNVLSDFTVGKATNSIKIPGMFPFRRAALNLRADLQTDESQIKFKSIALVQEMLSEVIEQVH